MIIRTDSRLRLLNAIGEIRIVNTDVPLSLSLERIHLPKRPLHLIVTRIATFSLNLRSRRSRYVDQTLDNMLVLNLYTMLLHQRKRSVSLGLGNDRLRRTIVNCRFYEAQFVVVLGFVLEVHKFL